jgi:thiol:disulfide interchange protein DsbD
MRTCNLGLFVCLVIFIFPGFVFAEPPVAGGVTAQLIAENTSIHPGTPFVIAVHLRMNPGWHIYWKNPGDTGLPTAVAWDLPKGFAASDIMWPAPQRFIALGLASYGYEGEVSLLARIVPPAELGPGEVTIHARVTWLACRTECTPGKADLALSLPVRLAAPIADKRWEAILRISGSMVPTLLPGVSSSSRLSAGQLLLRVDDLPFPSGSTVYFVPSRSGELAEGASQNTRISASSVTIDLQPAKQANSPRVQGVLVVQDQAGVHGVEIDAPFPVVEAGQAGLGARGFLIALALAFVGGLILNLMPCVLPVISLKILSFVRNSREASGGALRHGLLFASGVLVSFWAIAGILIALRAGGQLIGWGFQFQSPVVVAFTASLFFLIALNLLDVFELRLPIHAAALSSRGGGTRSFMSGLLAAAVATPCTAPFMGAALGYALSKPAAAGFGVFTALALGLAAPYVLLSALPGLVAHIPRPGAWMVTLRQILAFPMLGAVIWMMYILDTLAGFPALMTLLCALLLAGFGVWIFGRWGGLGQSVPSRAIASTLALVLVLGSTAFAALRSANMSAQTPDPNPSVSWESWTPERVAELQATGTPVFVDFTARWCLTCQVNERVAFHSPTVARAFREAGVVTLRADWTDRSDAIAKVLASYNRAGVPVYALYPRASTSPILLPELLTPSIVLKALQELR